MKLNPTLWRTCRVIANETRLNLLWTLFDETELPVWKLSQRTDMSMSNTSTQLRALHSRGLISMRRKKMMVLYRAEPNTALAFAPRLLQALQNCHDNSVSFKTVIRMATAFTHERRIDIVKVLNTAPLDYQQLLNHTGMSTSALSRHLGKLIARGYVKEQKGIYRLTRPRNLLGRTLLDTACAPNA